MINKITDLKVKDLENYIFSVYEYEGLTIQELLNVFFTKINEVVDRNNSIIDLVEWLVNEGLNIAVAEKLEQWLIDGTLSEIINTTIFNELRELILNANNRIDDLELKHNEDISSIRDFNFNDYEPFYITECDPIVNNVAQGIAVDNRNYEIYMATLYSGKDEGWQSGNYEHFQISRLKPNGNRYEYMKFKNGGHGTTFGFEIENNDVYIWNVWAKSLLESGQSSNPGGIPGKDEPHILGRVKWQAGRTIELANVETFPMHGEGYFIPTISSDQSLIAFRHDRNIKVFDFYKYKQGIHDLKYEFEIPEVHYYLQGFTLDSKYFYWRRGDSTEVAGGKKHEDILIQIDMSTGQVVNEKLIVSVDTNGFNEPEGIYMLEKGNSQTLYLCTIHDNIYKRMRCLYIMGDRFTTLNALGFTKYNPKRMLWKDSGHTWSIPKGTTRLSDIVEPGYYYIEGKESELLLDSPSSFTGGCWLFVSPKDFYGNTIYQEYIRNSGSNPFKVYRTISLNTGEIGKWGGNGQEETLWSGDGSAINVGGNISLSRPISDFDYIIIKYGGGSGGNSYDQMIYVPYITGDIIQSGINLGDTSPKDYIYMYEHALSVSSNKQTLTIKRRNRVFWNGSSFSENINFSEIYVSRVIGVNL